MGFHDFLTIGVFSGFSENPQDFLQIPGIRDFFPGIRDFFLRNSEFFSLGIFMQNSRDFYPRVAGFLTLKSGDFYPRGLGIFEKSEDFYPRDWHSGFLGIFISGFFGDKDFLGLGIFRG